MKVLAFTTATPRCTVALLDGEQTLASAGYEDGMAHAERLFSVVDQVMASAACVRGDLDAIACDVGPGSFTGVRVGVAAAKGIALGLGLPLWPVGSLEAMAAAAFADERSTELERVACLLDAQRGELFVAVYGRRAELLEPCEHIPLARVAARLAGLGADPACGFVGRPAAEVDAPAARRLSADATDLPRADWLARIAMQRARDREPPPLATIEPSYVRGPDAKVQVTTAPRPLPR